MDLLGKKYYNNADIKGQTKRNFGTQNQESTGNYGGPIAKYSIEGVFLIQYFESNRSMF